ncbi:MAG TPA: 2-C-methyl-D-erythritol 4-phosphate cytidylyltransferase [Longimicrobiales bacterium]|nr:2-C-methyl-D-erythritol 4-phosphate cytidylyltransferase [Longimicrobiales bacterium]
MSRAAVIVAAGGAGHRMGGVRKQYLELAGVPVLAWALRPFLEHPAVEWAVVALPAEDAVDPPAWLTGMDPRILVVAGGVERTHSVRNALEAVPPEADVVLVHDAARPLVTLEIVERTLAAASRGLSAVAGVPPVDTIKVVDRDGLVRATPERGGLRSAQTPQAFPRAVLVEAHRRAAMEGLTATDDAALVERYGGDVVVVEGSPENLKVTGPLDVRLAEAILRARGA